MTRGFDELFRGLMAEDAAPAVPAPAGAMSSGPIVAASVGDPGSKDAVYTLARPFRGRKGKKRKIGAIAPVAKRSALG